MINDQMAGIVIGVDTDAIIVDEEGFAEAGNDQEAGGAARGADSGPGTWRWRLPELRANS